MNIDITELFLGKEDFINIDKKFSFSKEQLDSTNIIELNDIKITGEISRNNINEYILNIIVKGTMVLPCALTLKPVNYDFETEIDGNIKELYEEINENYENNQKAIDILPIIWENILMEIPIRIVSDDVSDIQTKGNGWQLITDER